MRLLSLIGALLMFLGASSATAQQTVTRGPAGSPVGGLAGAAWADRNNDGYVDGYIYNGTYYAGAPAGASATAPSVSAPQIPAAPSGIDPRWGVLGEMVERNFEMTDRWGLLAAVRWETPNLAVEWSMFGWGDYKFVIRLDPASGKLSTTAWKQDYNLFAAADGAIMQRDSTGREAPFITRDPDGQYRLHYNGGSERFRLHPAGGPKEPKFQKIVAQGRLRAADPTLNTQLASAPAVPQLQQVAPQTVITHNIDQTAAPPASSVAPAVAAAAAVSGPRYALVIGNSQYQASLGRLPNPVNDAQSVAAALRAVGFDVDLVVDADQKGMKRAISRFGERLSMAGRGATGLFYYAGHGIQSRGTNYLIPVSAPIEREADLDLEAVAADTVLAQMEDAGAATSIVILDACRNMPLARSFRSASRGLARMDAPNGSFVAYSTAPGAVAADGDGRNSPFAIALVKQLGQKGAAIEAVFRGVRREVVQATGGQQTPWDSSSLLDPFYFVP